MIVSAKLQFPLPNVYLNLVRMCTHFFHYPFFENSSFEVKLVVVGSFANVLVAYMVVGTAEAYDLEGIVVEQTVGAFVFVVGTAEACDLVGIAVE